MRGILINPFDTTITEVNYTGDYKEIYALTDCTTFDCVRIYETQDMYIDDEGLLKNNQMYFTMNDRVYAGKALLLSHDDEGETISTNLDLQMVEDMVEWLPEGHTEEPYMEFITL
jgi:hypothetical protein